MNWIVQYLEDTIFKGYKNGFYMDIGAHDGVTINNTIYFEKTNNWTGINVEPIIPVYNKLIINRPNNINLNCAVCNKDGTATFVCNTGYTEMISGLLENYDERHHQRLQRENQSTGASTEMILVNTKKVESICDEYSIKNINLLSIDVEGAEFEVIKSINFDKVFIDVIVFENNYNDSSDPIIDYLKNKDYKMIYRTNDIFMIHRNSSFFNNIQGGSK